jgi:hypothetical protein
MTEAAPHAIGERAYGNVWACVASERTLATGALAVVALHVVDDNFLAGSTLPMPVPLRPVLLLAPPLALAALEILHPQPDENVHAPMDVRGGEAGGKASRSRGAP